MTRRLQRVLGANAALAVLVLGCSASQSDDSGTGGTGPQSSAGAATGGRSGASTGGASGAAATNGGAPGGGVAMGGAPAGAATGGAPPSGGSSGAAGGSHTAGTSSGGSANGGATQGGATPGGATSGGSPSGGKASGGTGNGGTATAGGGGVPSNAGAGGGGATEKRSLGCGKATTQTANQWVESTVMTGGASRPYSVRLPSDYDPDRAYPIVVLLHGCGGGTNNVPMEKATGSDAILVRGTGSAASTCWDTSANGKDVAFFDALLADAESRFCADESRVFIVGYSSGAWLVNQLTCLRADVVRGAASVAGGESSNGRCGVPVARIFLHDTNDTDNPIASSERARDRQLTQNLCDESAPPADVEPSPCKAYSGCADGYPVHWCQTSGNAHGRQDSFAPSAFWSFFESL